MDSERPTEREKPTERERPTETAWVRESRSRTEKPTTR
jgi:hypothetical protein